MMIPTIHSNGTSKETLLSEWEAAYSAIGDALDSLAGVTVNGRDFYPQGGNAINEAAAEQEERCKKLREMRTEIEEIINGICAQ